MLFSVGAALFSIMSLSVSLVLLLGVRRMRQKIATFLSGKNGDDLEAIILKQEKSIGEIEGEIRNLYGAAEELYRLGQESVHRTELLRFNPFKEVGGNQSFVLALLNGRNTGFVLSSLHTREGTRIYAKPVTQGAETKEHPLSKEEKYAVSLAAKKRPAEPTGEKPSRDR